MTHEIKENDVVALLVDLPAQVLHRGDVGTVIEVFEQNEHHPDGFIIEFVDETGRVHTHADITDSSQIIRLHFTFQSEAA